MCAATAANDNDDDKDDLDIEDIIDEEEALELKDEYDYDKLD